MLTRSRRRQGQISSEQEGRDVTTDEAPSVEGAGTEEPTTMSDGGEANASGSRSSHLVVPRGHAWVVVALVWREIVLACVEIACVRLRRCDVSYIHFWSKVTL